MEDVSASVTIRRATDLQLEDNGFESKTGNIYTKKDICGFSSYSQPAETAIPLNTYSVLTLILPHQSCLYSLVETAS
jgi:hypothetical protein